MTEEKINITVPLRRTRNSKTTFSMCVRDAKKCEYVSEWSQKYPVTYSRACRKNWLKFISDYTKLKRKKKHTTKISKITYEKCLESAKNYNVVSEWQEKDVSTYRKACKEKWIDKIIIESGLNNNHREKKAKGIIKRVGRLTFEMCVEDATQCGSIGEWQKKFTGSYSVANTNGWIDTVIEKVGIKRLRNIKGELNLENVTEIASKYETIKDWRNYDYKSYYWAASNGYLQAVKNRVNFRPSRFERDYTIDECAYDAKKYQSLHQWMASGELYGYAKYKNWIDVIIERVGFQKGSSKKGWWYEM
jgi:tRNA(His) 5'-end guanylyltransferase